MDDFERDLSRLMRDTQQHTPYEAEHRQRLHAGIRARRRARMLWKAGGSAVAVAGISVGLALLPGMLTRAQPPADHRPPPATSPTSSVDTTPTTDAPEPSYTPTQPESTAPATTSGTVTPSGTPSATSGPTPTDAAPSPTGRSTSAPPTPPPSPTPTTVPPSVPESEEPSASASLE
ncbi:cellulase [Streptomyces sp. NPDC086081]|uniref:cellulase n=1 Tax=Streptomyces sp. NPDC086081 TaxID=3365749 RepID=UPI0038213F0E